jgi:predicted transcriptional regulator
MPAGGRVNVTLDEEHAAKLARLAERTQIQEGTLARSLLSQALDDADLDARNVVELLDGIPGAFERARQGLEDARAGRTVGIDDL